MKRELTIEKKLKIAIDALRECVNPAGHFDLDKLSHAENCIKNTGNIAKIALKKIGVDFYDIKIDQS